jgi:hypothetical protein
MRIGSGDYGLILPHYGFGEATITVTFDPPPYQAHRPMPLEWASGDGQVGGPCWVDSDCWSSPDTPTEAYCVASTLYGGGVGSCYAPKNRYLSIAANGDNSGLLTARRITHVESGLTFWVGEPYSQNGMTLAPVVQTPYYADWPAVVQVTDCEIAPQQEYLIQSITEGQDLGGADNYSEPLVLRTAQIWGDVVSTCFDNTCLPPDGIVGIDDLLGTIARFQGIDNAPLPWFDVDPNQAINIGDILACLGAFSGDPYDGPDVPDCN